MDDSNVIETLLRRDYALAEDFWPAATCDSVIALMEEACTPQQPWLRFPQPPERHLLNELAVDPRVVSLARQYLEAYEIYMCGCHYQRRSYGDGLDREQPLHVDEGSNTLLVESRDAPYRYFVMLTYWSDVGPGDGSTWIVPDPAKLAAEVQDVKGANFPHGDPKHWFEGTAIRRYESEMPVLARRGSALVYNLHLVHRGSAMTGDDAVRYVSWVTYRAHCAPWAGQDYWGGRMARTDDIASVLEAFDPHRRNLLGVPMPGHPFWTRDTIARVQSRYPGLDMTPYRDAL